MNKPPDDPTNKRDVVPVDAPQLPASKRPPDKFRLYRLLEQDADEILDEANRLDDLERRIRHREPGDAPPNIKDVELDECFASKIKRCRERLTLLDPEEFYDELNDDDDDGGRLLKKKIISKRLGAMLVAVCIGELKMPEGFEHMLLEHVYVAQVSYLALDGACYELEKNKKLSPPIATVLEAIEEHQRLWWDRQKALATIERTSAELVDEIQKLKPQFAIEQAEANVREIRARWTDVHRGLQARTKATIDAQNAARDAHLKVEEQMAWLAVCEQRLGDAAVALRQATDVLETVKEQQATPVS